jgi:hypothetical protein
MSSIDLTNPQVLKNYLKSLMREGKGEFSVKNNVVVFKDIYGSEYIAPQDILKEMEIVDKTTNEVKVETPELEPLIDDDGSVRRRKKKRILV